MSSFWKWLYGDKPVVRPPKPPRIIGDWRSDVIETRRTGQTHYEANTVKGVRQILDMIESSGGRGGATVKWWVPGLHFKLTAYLPIECLIEAAESPGVTE